MLRAATAAVRTALVEDAGVDNWGVAEVVAKAALGAALAPGVTPAMVEAGIAALRAETMYVLDCPYGEAQNLARDVIERALAARLEQSSQIAA
jgi:hypothetical protein